MVLSVVLVIRGIIFSVTSTFSAQGKGRRSRVTSSQLRARFHLWWNREILRVHSGKWIARICLWFTSNLLFSIVVEHPRTALNAILFVLRLIWTMLTVPSWSSKGLSVMILYINMLKRVGESRHPCRTPTVVRNQSPMLLLKRTALVALL